MSGHIGSFPIFYMKMVTFHWVLLPSPHTWMVRDDLAGVLRTATRAAAGGGADAPCGGRERGQEVHQHSRSEERKTLKWDS